VSREGGEKREGGNNSKNSVFFSRKEMKNAALRSKSGRGGK